MSLPGRVLSELLSIRRLVSVINAVSGCKYSVVGGNGGNSGNSGNGTWICGSSAAVLEAVKEHVEVLHDFITEEEEQTIFSELEPALKKKKYQFDHWDDVGTRVQTFTALFNSY